MRNTFLRVVITILPLLLVACSSSSGFILGRPAPSITPTPVSGGWVLYPPAGLPGYEDAKTIWLELLPKGETSYSSVSRYLSLVCAEGKFSVRIGLREEPEHKWPHSWTTVRIRFDNDEPITLDARRRPSVDFVWLPDPESYLVPLLKHDEMVFEFTPSQLRYFRPDPIAITFDLRGLAVAIKPLVKACNLPIH